MTTMEGRIRKAERAVGRSDAGDHEILVEIDWGEDDEIAASYWLDGRRVRKTDVAGLVAGADRVVKVDWGAK